MFSFLSSLLSLPAYSLTDYKELACLQMALAILGLFGAFGGFSAEVMTRGLPSPSLGGFGFVWDVVSVVQMDELSSRLIYLLYLTTLECPLRVISGLFG